MDVFEQPKHTSVTRVLVTSAACVFSFFVVGALALSYVFFQPITLGDDRIITVEKGETASSLAGLLKREGIIRSAIAFKTFFTFAYPTATIKAGEYTLSGAPTLVDTALLFIQGSPSNERTITIIEGWTLRDIARYLEAEGVTSEDDFLAVAEEIGNVRRQKLEGYLFPDTYRVFTKSSSEEIITRMLENFDSHYTPAMVAQTKTMNRDMHGIVTLASILEREVRGERDRRIVADLFYRRLAQGMPLQADSTINYITGKKDAQARFTDLEVNSPYNTYRHKGLPPGPIGNPGLEALQAALSPIENPFWFFLTTPEGEVVYSKTFEEHVKNKFKYLSKE
ncbi:MAG: endolytic transglycosylase MltG [Patescibacteria group bacterium]